MCQNRSRGVVSSKTVTRHRVGAIPPAVCVLNYTISLLVEPDARNYSWRRFDQLSGAMRTLEREKSSKNTRQIGNPFHPFFVLHHHQVGTRHDTKSEIVEA